MDTDNRVVLNCGGIRHEVYKVSKAYVVGYMKLSKTYEISIKKALFLHEFYIFFNLQNGEEK